MSSPDFAIVRRFVAAVNDRDTDGLLALLDQEVELESLRAQLEGRVFEGHDGARKMMAAFEEDWEYLHVDIDELREAGDGVLGLCHLRSRGRVSGVDLDVPVGFLFRVREGKVVYGKVFSDPDDALAAAGLSP